MADLLLQDELELTVVGTLLLEGRLIGETLPVLTPADFTGNGARLLYEALGRLFLAGKPTDELSVLLEAGEDCKAVTDLILDRRLWTTAEGLAHYREELRKASRLRQLRSLGEKLAGSETAEGAEAIVSRLNGALAGRREARVVSIQDAVIDFMARLDETPVYLPWGIPMLDETLTAEPGDFIALGGYSSSGKTLLAIQFALHMAKTYRVGFFSLETGEKKLTDRAMAYHAKIAMTRIKRRTLTTADYDILAVSAPELGALSMDLIDAAGMSVTDIQAVSLQHRYQIIFVDYLQLVTASGPSFRERVAAVSMGLHTFAQAHKVAVIALAQINRPEKSKDGGKPVPPSMFSFKESSQIENDVDVALILYPEDLDNNKSDRILKISKNKDGEKDRVKLAFDGPTQTLTPVRDEEAVRNKLVNEGRKAKRKARREAQEALDGFRDTDEEVPWDGSEFG